MTLSIQGYNQPSGWSPTFAPPMIPGCVLWLRADLGTTIATGVSQWNDQSGTGDSNKNCAQATGSAQPTLNVMDGQYNNQATLSFASGSSQRLFSGTWASALAIPSTWIVVGHDSMTTSTNVMLDGLSASFRQTAYTTTTNLNLLAGSSVCGAAANVTIPSVIAGSFINPNGSLYLNNSSTALVTSSLSPWDTLQGVSVGAAYNGSSPMNGKIAEVIAYANTPTAGQLNAIFRYLAYRYGIVAS